MTPSAKFMHELCYALTGKLAGPRLLRSLSATVSRRHLGPPRGHPQPRAGGAFPAIALY
jgi:hypothetical protein